MKWLIGGLLSIVPIANLLVAGYFLRYARQLRAGDGLILPAWDNWSELALDGLRMVVLKLVFFGIPVLVGGLLWALFAYIFNLLYLSFFGITVAGIFFFIALAVGFPLWMAAMQRYLPSQDWHRVFDLAAVARATWRMAPSMAFPTLALWGLLLLGWPLIGFAFFLGFGPYVALGTAVYLGEKSALAA